MIKSFCIFVFSLMSLVAFAQNYTDGFHVGYKAGYCYKDYGCAAPSSIPSLPKPGKNTYQDGYNDGFAKGQADKAGRDANRKPNSSNQSTPRKADPIHFNEAINSGIKQSQDNKKSELEIKQKRLEIEQQEIELLKIRNEQEKAYEQKTNKTPEIDFQSGAFEKFKIKTPNKYSIQIFNPEKWSELTPRSDFHYGQRKYEDGTEFMYTIRVLQSPKGTGADYINAIYDTASLTPKITLDIQTQESTKGLLITSVEFGKSGYISGVRVGDIITKIDNTFVTDDMSKNEALKNKVAGDSVNIHLIRNSEELYTVAKLNKKEAYYFGKLTISGFPGVFVVNVHEVEDYGKKIKNLKVSNIIAVNNDIIFVNYLIYPSSEFANFDAEFERFRNTIKIHLGNVTIK